jgi:ABC-type dipeptide/oligopeptide/nickel transport system permease subunit
MMEKEQQALNLQTTFETIQELGLVRVAFVLFFFSAYAVLVMYSWSGIGDPEKTYSTIHEGISLEQVSIRQAKKTSELELMRSCPPSVDHPMGTDYDGRDVLVRLAYGAHTSFVIGLVATIFYIVFGAGFGVVIGYFEGRWQVVILYIFNVVNSFPILLFLLVAVIILDSLISSELLAWRMTTLMALMGIFSSPKLAELIRGRIASLKQMAFVQSAVSLGLSPATIIFKHILWHECWPIIAVQAAYIMGQAILMEVTLTYLDFGYEYPLISWGLIFRRMKGGIIDGEYQVLFVMGMIASAVFFFQCLAGLLNDALALRKGRS